MKLLNTINSPADLKKLPCSVLEELAAELRDYIVKEMETENTPADFRHETSQMWMLGLAEKDIDLQQLYIDLQTEQIGGFYDPETDTFYIIAENNRSN